MKRGSRYKTAVFGTDAEQYVSSLFIMGRNPNGNRRPDLISINGRYTPKLSIELKSGESGKVSMVAFQLHYAITTGQDYEEFFEEKFSNSEGMLPNVDWNTNYPQLVNNPVAYYYDIISREKKVTSQDLNKPFSAFKLTWGDQYIIPHHVAFSSFAVARSIRTGEKLDDVVEILKDRMKDDILEKSSHYSSRSTQDWQNLYAQDMRAIFYKDSSLATEGGKKRIDLLAKHNRELDGLERVVLDGPLGTKIHVLADPDDKNLFMYQMHKTLLERNPVLERIAEVRKRALKVVDNLPVLSTLELFENGDGVDPTSLGGALSFRSVSKLKYLASWRRKEDDLLFHETHKYDPISDGCSDEIEELPEEVSEESTEIVPF